MCVADTNYTTLRQYIYTRVHLYSKLPFPLFPRSLYFFFKTSIWCLSLYVFVLLPSSFSPLFISFRYVGFIFIGVQSTPPSIQHSLLSSTSLFCCFILPELLYPYRFIFFQIFFAAPNSPRSFPPLLFRYEFSFKFSIKKDKKKRKRTFLNFIFANWRKFVGMNVASKNWQS